jgi:NTE family protein
VIHSGNPGHAVQASSSIPGAVIAIDYQGDVLVDGGLLSVVPVYPLREMGANKVIAVDIYCHNQKSLTPDASAGEVVIATIRMQSCRLSEEEMNSADLVINMDYEPSSFADFDSKSEAIEAGYQITKKMMPSIKALIEL